MIDDAPAELARRAITPASSRRSARAVADRTEELLPGASGTAAATWVWLTRAGRLVEAFTRDVLADAQLDTSELTILLVLWYSGSPYQSTPAALAGETVLTQSGLARALQRAETKGAIRKTTDPSDARALIIELTADGRSLVERTIDELLRRFNEALGSPEEPDLTRLANSASLLAGALDPAHHESVLTNAR